MDAAPPPGWTPSPFWTLEGDPRGGRLLVSFSHIDEPEGRFSLYGTLREPPAARLLLNTPANAWYRDGVPGVAADAEGLAEALRTAVAALGPAEVLGLGVSMGGYAAILFGALAGFDRVLAFGPETELKLPGSRSSRFVGDRPAHPFDDVLPVLPDRRGGGRIDVLAGESDLVDLHCALRISHLPGVRVRTFRGVGHEVPAALHRFDAFRPLVADWVAGRPLPAALPLEGRILEAGAAAEDLLAGARLRAAGDRAAARSRLARSLAAYPDSDAAHAELAAIDLDEGKAADAEKRMRRALRLAPDSALWQHRLGLALAAQRRWAEAEEAHRTAADWAKGNALFRLHHAMAVAEQGRDADALDLFGEVLRLHPGSAQAHHQAGLLHARRGDHAAAAASQRAALEGAPRNAAVHHRLALALEALGDLDRALEAHEAASALNPRNPTLRRSLDACRSAMAARQPEAAD